MKHALSLSALALISTLGTACTVPSGGDETLGSAEQAIDGPVFGWAWVHSDGSLGSPYANQTTGSASSHHLGLGTYEVDFVGLHQQGNAHVVAYGSNAHCKLWTTPIVSGTQVATYVTCYNPTGGLVDSAFAVTFNGQPAASTWMRGAYLSTGGGTSPSLVGGNWNSAGGSNSVTWDATNQVFHARFGSMPFSNASVHVTAYGANDNRCKVVGWGTGDVTVKCFDHAGNPTSSGFSISYTEFSLFGGHLGGHAFVWGGVPQSGYSNSAPVFECDSPGAFSAVTNAFNANNLDVTLTKSDWSNDTGPWVVPIVTAYGSDTNYCNVASWSASGANATSRVTVQCFDGSGTRINASNTPFDVTISHRDFQGPC